MTREAFQALLRHPQTTILLNRWAKEEEVARALQARREQRRDAFDRYVSTFCTRTDPVTK